MPKSRGKGKNCTQGERVEENSDNLTESETTPMPQDTIDLLSNFLGVVKGSDSSDEDKKSALEALVQSVEA
ncbi:uncharacterized protein FFB20_05080 [Fusarium fujikuroi]|uniref:Uncharacterized protein n=2 Tax=Fusarium fujikuroi TaxID=5127 RepID=S0DLJ1_GIBF5|nr:uncharacterized protein FFUJ_01244 [Fusarium fujikuroi IMI 58289]KLO86159.1 uncharacterized protein Y057_14076 [Fusarium fujikuroi]KLP16230.1 uncharacterized protein LW94_9371 [Fusarium fujikuroi]QGI58679.1 hypothetical protein CEK27_000804 [Fusarium fujikuroi]QGI75897.1 hypothetical protein CEK25_000803 [Fusarium fujikuroi]QGI89588.1 hypothetical protein CEK26_000803 [Fusarium fujikuroi]